MFEKEAEEIAEDYYYKTYPVTLNIGEEERKKEVTDIFLAGYNKANEWHDLRKDNNDLPKENMKQVMVITNHNDCLMGWYCIHQKTWWSSDCPDADDRIETEDIMKVKVIKWKEIVLPELKESE